MKNIFSAFIRRTEGQVSVLMALAAVPLLIAAGAAIDRVRLDNARTEMQAAVDGAAMAAALAETGTDQQRKAIAQTYFKQNFAHSARLSYALDVKVNADNVVVHGKSPAADLLHAAGRHRQLTLEATADVMRSLGGNAEVVMVLDYSGSMNAQNKVARMARAATEMVEQLSRGTRRGQLKVGLVPFSAMVRTTMRLLMSDSRLPLRPGRDAHRTVTTRSTSRSIRRPPIRAASGDSSIQAARTTATMDAQPMTTSH